MNQSLPLRTQTIQKAGEILALQPLFLDTETTGLGNSDEIIEISVFNHQEQEVFQSLVKPTSPIPPQSSQIHHITNEMVNDAPSWNQIAPQIETLLKGKVVCIYNAEFDVRLMRQSYQKYRVAWTPSFSPVCIMKLYAAFIGDWNAQKNDFRFFSLEKAGEQCGISLPNSHRAGDDTRLTLAILQHLSRLPE